MRSHNPSCVKDTFNNNAMTHDYTPTGGFEFKGYHEGGNTKIGLIIKRPPQKDERQCWVDLRTIQEEGPLTCEEIPLVIRYDTTTFEALSGVGYLVNQPVTFANAVSAYEMMSFFAQGGPLGQLLLPIHDGSPDYQWQKWLFFMPQSNVVNTVRVCHSIGWPKELSHLQFDRWVSQFSYLGDDCDSLAWLIKMPYRQIAIGELGAVNGATFSGYLKSNIEMPAEEFLSEEVLTAYQDSRPFNLPFVFRNESAVDPLVVGAAY